MLAGSAVMMMLQGVYFIIVARSLGPEQYGAFIGAVSLIAVLSPFSAWGTGGILVRNVSRQKKTFADSWGNALSMTAVSGSILLGVVLLLSRLILSGKIPLVLLLLVGASDLILAPVVVIAGQVFQAHEMLKGMAEVGIALAVCRAVGAVLMLLWSPHHDVVFWANLYLGGTGIGAVYAFARVSRSIGYPRLALVRLKADILEGFYFSISQSSQSIYNNIDKTLMVRLATLQAAGIYATAYRVLDFAFQPVSSLLYSTYARFFQHGSQGIRGSSRYAKRILPYALGYSAVIGFGLFIAAPLLPVVVGRGYAGADEALRWLSPILLFRSAHYFLSNSLTGADFQGVRSAIQVAVAVVNLVLNLWLIPAYSWRGAAWASLASDGLLMIGVLLAVVILSERASLLSKAPAEGTT
jgi:O-antigen/teichoic acid export membrane protein